MKINLIKLFLLLALINIPLCKEKEYSLSLKQKKYINQAKSLESTGLIDEAKDIYKKLLKDYPYMDEAFNALKKISVLNDDLDDLIPFVDSYIASHKYSKSKIINVFEIYLLTQSNKVDESIALITENKNPDLYFASKIISILLNYGKETKVNKIISHIRNNTKSKNFYSLQLGMYYSIQGNIKKAMDEYIVYLKNNKKNINIISNRIMTLTDNDANIEIIKNILMQNNQIESKIILSNLEFKLKNYQKSYELLDLYSNDDKLKIAFIEDLIKIDNFDLSEEIINSIIKKSKNKNTITKAIFLLAQLFENKLIEKSNQLPISEIINTNEILDSPFIKINEKHASLLENATNIYDSLSINLNDYSSTFHLAEIKYRIQGDLDGALNLYTDIFNKIKSADYKIKSLERIIDIYHSKGDLNGASEKIEKYMNLNNEKIKTTLNIKKIQNYFYAGDKKTLVDEANNILKTLSKNNKYYNDILDIISIAYLIDNQDEFNNYATSKFKLMQNKRVISMNILDSLKSESTEVNSKVQYEKSYLNVMQGNYNKALEIINKVSEKSAYAEDFMLLKGEILDFLIKDKSKAVDIYLEFLDLFPDSVYYDLIRIRLREITNEEI